jgi:hypothetical protein
MLAVAPPSVHLAVGNASRCFQASMGGMCDGACPGHSTFEIGVFAMKTMFMMATITGRVVFGWSYWAANVAV